MLSCSGIFKFKPFCDSTTLFNVTLPFRKSSPLKTLSPFLDEDLLLRLDRRLKNAAVFRRAASYNLAKIPCVQSHHKSDAPSYPSRRSSTRSAPTLLALRRAKCRERAHKAVRDLRSSPHQLMGDLPASCVNPSPPFAHTGVDYADSFIVIPFVDRGQRARKNYVALKNLFVSLLGPST